MISQDLPALEFDTAFSLLGCHTDFFGDWLCESITKYVAVTLAGHLPSVPILIDANMPKTHRQALELMLVPGTNIIEIPAFEGTASVVGARSPIHAVPSEIEQTLQVGLCDQLPSPLSPVEYRC